MIKVSILVNYTLNLFHFLAKITTAITGNVSCIFNSDLKQRIAVKLINLQGLEEAGVDGGGLFR